MIQSWVNIERYPLHALEQQGADLIKRVRGELEQKGACVLDDFVDTGALNQMVREAESLVHLAYRGPTEATPYFFDYDLASVEEAGPDHPLRRTTPRNLAQVAADLIPGEHILSRLYRDPAMTGFLSRILGRPVYRNADPHQCLNISVMESGGCQQWHFDAGDMVTTLLLQAPEAGGIFEFVPNIRSQKSENFEDVGRILDGDRTHIRQCRLQAGSLNLFRGHYSLHRVTPVIGNTRRLQAILGYTATPGLKGSLKSSALHYGVRVAAKSSANRKPV